MLLLIIVGCKQLEAPIGSDEGSIKVSESRFHFEAKTKMLCSYDNAINKNTNFSFSFKFQMKLKQSVSIYGSSNVFWITYYTGLDCLDLWQCMDHSVDF